MSEKLLPCPFCNGPADYTGREGQGYRVVCKHCDARGGWGDYGYQAEAAWNRRTPQGMEAGTGETEGLDPKGDSPGPKGIAVNTGHSTPGDAEVRKALADAYAKGAEDVHAEWLRAHDAGEGPPRGDPEFGEAAGDYADAALDPFNSAALATPSGRAQEPVAWMWNRGGEMFRTSPPPEAGAWQWTALYAAPPAQDQTK